MAGPALCPGLSSWLVPLLLLLSGTARAERPAGSAVSTGSVSCSLILLLLSLTLFCLLSPSDSPGDQVCGYQPC